MPTEVKEKMKYTDLLKLENLPDGVDNKYSFKIKEIRNETSYIDKVSILAVDHDSGVEVSNDLKGNIWGYKKDDLESPRNSSPKTQQWDNDAQDIYHGDVLDFDFENVRPNDDSILVIRLDGFEGESKGDTFERPKLILKTQDSNGKWVARDTVYPREFYTEYALSTKDWFNRNYQVRIEVRSCHTQKYHLLDFVGIDKDGANEKITINNLNVNDSLSSIFGQNFVEKAKSIDGDYYIMPSNSWVQIDTAIPEMKREKRTIVIETTGYYVVNE